MASKKCPVCGVSVKAENLERHVRDQHPHEAVSIREVLSRDEVREIEETRKGSRLALSRSGKRIAILAVAVLAVLLAIAIANPFGNVGPGIGQTAPDFTRPTSTGGSVALSAYRGYPVLLEFMDVDCEFCQTEAPILTSVYADYSGSVRFLSVDANFIGASDTAARIEAFKSTYGTGWTYALDTDGAVTRAYGVSGTPTTFILDPDGVVLQIIRGRAPAGYTTYAAALDSALGS